MSGPRGSEEPDGRRVTFDKEVHYWEAELSMIAEAHQLLDEVQREFPMTLHTVCLGFNI